MTTNTATAQDVDYLAAVVAADAPVLDRDGTPRFLSPRDLFDPETDWTAEDLDEYWREERREAGPWCGW